MTIIIDTSILWGILGIAIWLFVGMIGLLMMNATWKFPKWSSWGFIFVGPITFLMGLVSLIFGGWDT